MKKIDFHIHTVSSDLDHSFTFSLDRMLEYIQVAKLDAIAITNHNLFDETNYNQICNSTSIVVFPGIELGIEGSHILIIAPKEKVSDFKVQCQVATNHYKVSNTDLTFEEFSSIFTNYNEYLIIPHYKKKPFISTNLLNKFGNNIKIGEVSSAKKWFSCYKDNDSLVPVLFSDIRIKENNNDDAGDKLPNTLTYVSCDDLTIPTLKIALSDKTKVKISLTGEDEEFQILSDGTTASTGLNIIIGLRSSGKTYTIENIFSSFRSEYVKYIKQFSIVKQAEEREFKKRIENDNNEIIEKNLIHLKSLVSKIADIDLLSTDTIIDEYLESLKDFAEKSENKDEFSNVSLFTATSFQQDSLDEIIGLIEAIQKLLDTTKYRETINSRVSTDALKCLLKDLIILYRKEKLEQKIILASNSLIDTIKHDLEEKSCMSTIKDIDFDTIAKNNYEIIKFNDFINKLKDEKVLENETSLRFTINAKRTKFTSATEVKKNVPSCPSISTAFSKYDNPYEYVRALKEAGVTKDYLYKMIVDIQFNVLDDTGTTISGGERAEYILYSELKDASKYEVVLIDEPESSFDNIFLKKNIREKIKNLSRKTTVFVVTHNSTLGILMNPDKIIFTSKDAPNTYSVYTGTLSSNEFKTMDGRVIKSYKTLMDIMEAGEDSYKERMDVYESLNN